MNTTAVKSAATTSQTESEPLRLLRRIGSTTYVVNVHFSNKKEETLEGKILRMIEREVRDSA